MVGEVENKIGKIYICKNGIDEMAMVSFAA